MSSEDFVKYLTEKLVRFIDTPKEKRREERPNRERWSHRWFGMIPFSIKMMFKK